MIIGLPALGLLAALYLLQCFRIGVQTQRALSPVNVGTDGVFYLAVRNRMPWSTQAHLKVAGRPLGWPAATSFPMVNMDGGETIPVPLVVRVPVTAAPGQDYSFKVRARPNAWSPWLVSRTLTVRTIDIVVERPAVAAAAPLAVAH